ncbi:hypothetical protein SO694_00046034 [Aureococcus anophagefferens]|uniref:Carrier domain-containing protein n=1 Tax=Aureococcus anophagefferens TaxID=44056 RepID=A0ABR1G7W2_AURAN
MEPALAAALDRVGERGSCSGCVVTGRGHAYHVAEHRNQIDFEPASRRFAFTRDYLVAYFAAFVAFPKPLVAALNGSAYGGAATSTSHGDAVVAVDAAELSFPFRRWRVVPGCATAHLARLAGQGCGLLREAARAGARRLARFAETAPLFRYDAAAAPAYVAEARRWRLAPAAGGRDAAAAAVAAVVGGGAPRAATRALEASPSAPAVAVDGATWVFPRRLSTAAALRSALASGFAFASEAPVSRYAAGRGARYGAFLGGAVALEARAWAMTPVEASRYGAFAFDGEARLETSRFGASPAEARALDPQSGLVLHAAAEAAGDARDLGVFVGAGAWIRGASLPGRARRRAANSVYGATATALSLLSGRVSYALDLAGPCVSLDTACSSFLFALALARAPPGRSRRVGVGARAHRGRAVDLIRKNRRRRWRETATPSYVGLRTKRGENGVLQSPPPPPKAATSIPSAIGAIVPAPALVRAVALKDRATMFQTCAWATLCCPLVKPQPGPLRVVARGNIVSVAARGGRPLVAVATADPPGAAAAFRRCLAALTGNPLTARPDRPPPPATLRRVASWEAAALAPSSAKDDAADFILSRLKARGDIVVTKDARILDAVLAKIETMYGALAFSALRATFVARIAAKLRDALEQRYEVELAPNLLELYPTPGAIGGARRRRAPRRRARRGNVAARRRRRAVARVHRGDARPARRAAARAAAGGRRAGDDRPAADQRRRRSARRRAAAPRSPPDRRRGLAFAERPARAAPRRVARAALGAVAARPRRRGAEGGPRSAVATVERAVFDVVGAAVARDAPLLASGLDSLGVSELAGALSAAFGIALEPTFLFDHPTIAAAASGVVAALRAADAAAGADAAVDGWNVTDAAVLAL